MLFYESDLDESKIPCDNCGKYIKKAWVIRGCRMLVSDPECARLCATCIRDLKIEINERVT